jgi:ABC-type transporter Mla MlaB component
MAQRQTIVYDIVDCLDLPEGAQWRSFCVDLIARVEFELYRRAADIATYSNVSTLQRRLNELVADGIVLQTHLKKATATEMAADTTPRQPSTDITAVSTTDAKVIDIEAAAQQHSHAAYGSSSSITDISAADSSGLVVQRQQQQQQQQQQLFTGAATAATTDVQTLRTLFNTVSLIGSSWRSSQSECSTTHISSSRCSASTAVAPDSLGASVDCTSGKRTSGVCSTSCAGSTISDSNIARKWFSMSLKALQRKNQLVLSAAVGISSAERVSSNSEADGGICDTSSVVCRPSSADSSSNTIRSSGSSSGGSGCSIIKQLLALQAHRVAAERQQAQTARLTATAATTTLAEANARVEELEHDAGSCALMTALKAAAAVKASEACNAQMLAFEKLQVELRIHKEQQQCISKAEQHANGVKATTTSDTTTAKADESDSDDDCPPLALASSIEASDNSHTAAESMVAVGSTTDSSGSSSSSSSTGSEQTKQQPCVQCGKLTKKRCKRCQTVYYCSDERQIQCFKHPKHRAACEATAAAATTLAAPTVAAAAVAAPTC